MHLRIPTALALLVLLLAATSCASYAVPGAGADFRALGITGSEVEELTDEAIAERLEVRPLAGFPTSIAVVRVQGPDYSSRTARGRGRGTVTVVTMRDVESEEDFDRLAALPLVRSVAPLNRLVLPDEIADDRDLRAAAAAVRADMLLLYTFDTRVGVETIVPALGVISLGAFPSREARVTSTASAALLDTRNGYVYALAEATAQRSPLTTAWTTASTVDATRRAAESEAFVALVDEVAEAWGRVVVEYASPDAPPGAVYETATTP